MKKKLIPPPVCPTCQMPVYLAMLGEKDVVLSCRFGHVSVPLITTVSVAPGAMSTVTVIIEPEKL